MEVHDTGPGLTKTAFADACKRSVRLATVKTGSDGHGFGLDIVTDLAAQCAYRVVIL